ncbi:hypothetical protein EXE46_15100 [Halorubrum sp. GN11_10-6_MGM]|nr:hypothetical protein EXE46_15100 [Halorubrum sp. GN11_10-6_MGM]
MAGRRRRRHARVRRPETPRPAGAVRRGDRDAEARGGRRSGRGGRRGRGDRLDGRRRLPRPEPRGRHRLDARLVRLRYPGWRRPLDHSV